VRRRFTHLEKLGIGVIRQSYDQDFLEKEYWKLTGFWNLTPKGKAFMEKTRSRSLSYYRIMICNGSVRNEQAGKYIINAGICLWPKNVILNCSKARTKKVARFPKAYPLCEFIQKIIARRNGDSLGSKLERRTRTKSMSVGMGKKVAKSDRSFLKLIETYVDENDDRDCIWCWVVKILRRTPIEWSNGVKSRFSRSIEKPTWMNAGKSKYNGWTWGLCFKRWRNYHSWTKIK